MVSPTPNRDLAIETRGLRKVFGPRVAVSDLSLSVPRGQIFGFLGPNGAGKSTSIKMLLGLVSPTAGDAFVLGAPTTDVDVRRRIGFLPEDFRFYDWLTADELLEYHARLTGMSVADRRRRIPEVLELVGLGAHRGRRVRGFSKGMLQRVGLAQALVHQPDLVFLDEPTSGLDPMGRRLVRDVLRAQRDRGATVFLNSHLLSEIEITCDQVVFLRDGEVVAHRDLRGPSPDDVSVTVHATNISAAATAGLSRWATAARYEADQLRFVVKTRDALPDVIRHLVTAGAEVFSVTPERVPLEELFVQIMGEDKGL